MQVRKSGQIFGRSLHPEYPSFEIQISVYWIQAHPKNGEWISKLYSEGIFKKKRKVKGRQLEADWPREHDG